MNAKEAIEKIKLLFAETPVAPVAPVEPVAPVALATEYKLADGTVCSIDKLEVGGSVMIAGVPAPDGDLSLEDGTTLSVSGGLITVVTPKAEAPAEDVSQFAAEFNQFKADFESYKTQMTQSFNEAKEAIGTQNKALTELLKVVETLSKVEVAQPAQEPVAFEKMTPLQRFRATK